MLINKISFSLLVCILTVVYSTRAENLCTFHDDIPCDDGKCITRRYWCDGDGDCNDESDEKFCNVQSSDMCTDKHFFCDGKCMPIFVECDGRKDCTNDEDEKNCTLVKPTHILVKPTHSSQNEPENFMSTTTTKIYTSSYPTTVDYYGASTSESSNRNGYHDPHSVRNPPFITNNRNGYHDPHSVSNTYPHATSVRYGRNNNNNYDSMYFYPVNSYNRDHHNQFENGTPQTGYPNQMTSIDNRYDSSKSDDFSQQRPLDYWFTVEQTGTASSHYNNAIRPKYTHFYFAKNYTSEFEYDYENVIGNAKAWLLNQRDNSYSWDDDTPRALIALSIVSNSFKSDDEDNELMKKSIQTHLGIKLLRKYTGLEKMSPTRLAMYINVLLATCQNPHNFLGIDLVKSLYHVQSRMEQHQHFINPLIYLSLCLTDYPINARHLMGYIRNSFPTEISKDLHILATIAMACISHRHPDNNTIRAVLNVASQNLLKEMNPVNGSFGSKYTTALAVQALMSVNMSRAWNPSITLHYLAQQQIEDGSFGDMQTTFYTLIALSGRSLVHLRNTLCDTPSDANEEWTPEKILNTEGPKVTILYTVKADYPNFIPSTLRLIIPAQIDFIDIMRIAAYQNPRLKFSHKVSNGQLDVDMIAKIPNDPERGMFWNLYWHQSSSRSSERRYTVDFNQIRPDNNDEFIFWYQSDF